MGNFHIFYFYMVQCRQLRATVKVAPTYLVDIQAFVGATFTVALLHGRPCVGNIKTIKLTKLSFKPHLRFLKAPSVF